jgi:hypothetical protein
LRCLAVGLMIAVCAGISSDSLRAESTPADTPILDGMILSKQYLLEISGTVMNETFQGAQALLTVFPPPPVSKYDNPLLLVIQGFPKLNSRNSFFWNSEFSEMRAISNEVTCDIKRTYVKQTPIFFMFMSPELLKHTGKLELLGEEGKKFALRTALPTLVNARAGQLKLRINATTVSGTIWMKGYDPIEKSYVQYSARLFGRKSFHLQPKQEFKKGTTVGD